MCSSPSLSSLSGLFSIKLTAAAEAMDLRIDLWSNSSIEQINVLGAGEECGGGSAEPRLEWRPLCCLIWVTADGSQVGRQPNPLLLREGVPIGLITCVSNLDIFHPRRPSCLDRSVLPKVRYEQRHWRLVRFLVDRDISLDYGTNVLVWSATCSEVTQSPQ